MSNKSLERLGTIGTIVIKKYGTGDDRSELAQILSSCDAPTFQLRAADGTENHWRQDLTRPATPDETIRYWQQRTESAERLCAKLTEVNGKLLDSNQTLAERAVEQILRSLINLNP